jgi:hypothetical protein
MPELTQKQEAFAAAYVETGNGSKAYRLSHDVGVDTKPETVWSNASRLLADSKVSARVKELQAEARELLMVSVGTLTDELELARAKAMAEPKGASAAVSATLGKPLHIAPQLPIEDNADRGFKPSRRLFGAFMPRLLALGLPDPRQVLGVGLDLAAVEMRGRAIRVQVRAKQGEGALVFDYPTVFVAVDRLAAKAARRDVVAGTPLREDSLPALG